MSSQARAKIAGAVALEALQARYSASVHEICVEAYQAEERRRKQMLARRQHQREEKIDRLARGIASEVIRTLQTTAVVEAGLEELHHRRKQRAIFSRWQKLTDERLRTRDRKRRRREAFQAATQAMRLVPKSDISPDSDMDCLGKDLARDSMSVAAAIQRRSLMTPGTFFDTSCDHLLRIAALEDRIHANVMLSLSDTAQGQWLRRKFGLQFDDVVRHETGEATISASLHSSGKPCSDTVLCVFEWNEDAESLARIQRLVQDLPRVLEYNVGLCVISWRSNVRIPAQLLARFSFHSIADLSRDASDSAFELVLDAALPRLEKTEKAQANVKVLVDNLVPYLTTALATVRTVLDKSYSSLSPAQSALTTYLDLLDSLQIAVCEQFPSTCHLAAFPTPTLPAWESDPWVDRSDVTRALLQYAQRWPVPGELDDLHQSLSTHAGPIPHLILLFIHAVSERLYDHLTSINFDFLISQGNDLDRGAASTASDFANAARQASARIAALIPQPLDRIDQNSTPGPIRSLSRKRSFESSADSHDAQATPADPIDRKAKLRRAIEEAQRAIAT